MRYIIGIDLGTTNSCVSYVDTQQSRLAVQVFRIPQVVSPGYVENRPTLPSFCYLSADKEWPEGAVSLPWQSHSSPLVGYLAQQQGSRVPTRLVQSAKSWLCHPAINRHDKILPLEAADEKQRISPIEASMQYLSHIKCAWNHLMAKSDSEAEFDQQEIILTVPASFDEVARRLTIEAAKAAGYVHLTLLEEPQAAFYSWISLNESHWKQQLKLGDTILVCDVGGGTTDFSLIAVQEQNGQQTFTRLAVGNHLLLGGDNMDAALAHFIEEKFCQEHSKSEFSTTQHLQIKHQAREAKEELLSEGKSSQDTYTILLQGTGSSIVKGSLTVQIKREEVEKLLLDGFFRQYSLEEALKLRKSSGFRTMGLPYEEEPSITKHVAAFLKKASPQAPNYILFNGGSMKPLLFQQAILKSVRTWYNAPGIEILQGTHLDLAVGQGAAYYGKVRRGLGVRICGGIPKAYYLGVEVKQADISQHQALTLMTRGAEEGSSYEPEQTFLVRPNIPVSFNLYSSQVRLEDKKGDLVSIDPTELQLLPPILTILRFGKKQLSEDFLNLIPVKLHIGLSELGILELWLQSQKTNHRWNLEFQLRTSEGQDNSVRMLDAPRQDEVFDNSFLEPCKEYIFKFFKEPSKSEKIMESLETLIGQPRREWSTSILRELWETLLSVSPQRKINADREARWWNLAGFLLRPGFGYPLDDFRVKELWKIILNDFKGSKNLETQIQHWICYRRVAGGLNKGQQTQLATDIMNSLLPNKSSKIQLKNKNELYLYSEKIRTLASFELIETSQKIRLGQALMERILSGEWESVDYWALGRLGARHLIYGSIAQVVPKENCEAWIKSLLTLQPIDPLAHLFAQLARKTDHRHINIQDTLVDEILNKFKDTSHYKRLEDLLKHVSVLSVIEQEQLFGDKLPLGIVFETSV